MGPTANRPPDHRGRHRQRGEPQAGRLHRDQSLLYFQVGTILALATGLIAINLIPLGNGVNADVSTIQTSDAVNALIDKGETQHWWDFITHIVPSSMIEPFV